jgi:glycosyltransferase involved in cell wall biosynthesis
MGKNGPRRYMFLAPVNGISKQSSNPQHIDRFHMHILLVHQFFLEDQQGGGSRWNEMARMWVNAGHRVTVIAGNGHYMDTSETKLKAAYFRHIRTEDNIDVIRCFASSNYHNGFRGRLMAYFTFTFFATLAGLFHATQQYNLVLVSSPPLFVGLIGLILSWKKRIPLVFEVRDLWPDFAIDMGILKGKLPTRLALRFERLLYKKANMIVVLTPAFREVLIGEKGVAGNKIVVIPNGADFRWSEEVMNTMNVEAFRKQHALQDCFVVTYVGAHGYANNLGQILDAAEQLIDLNVIFLLIGDGAEREGLIRQAEIRHLTNVRFLGIIPKNDVFKYIFASDTGISVLRKIEIFKTIYSNKTFDYFSCKKPVIMGIDGISKKLIQDAKAGLYVKWEDAQDFAEKIRYYMLSPSIVAQHGENGYFYAKAHFDRENLAQQYLATLRSVSKDGI